jgi:hypothetical protein
VKDSFDAHQLKSLQVFGFRHHHKVVHFHRWKIQNLPVVFRQLKI